MGEAVRSFYVSRIASAVDSQSENSRSNTLEYTLIMAYTGHQPKINNVD